MSRLEQLPEITEHVLSGLRAGDDLKHRIYQQAAGLSDAPKKKMSRLPLAALCAISAVMVAVFILLSRVTPLNGSSAQTGQTMSATQMSPQIETISAGGHLEEPPAGQTEKEDEKDSPDEESEDAAEEDEPAETAEDSAL